MVVFLLHMATLEKIQAMQAAEVSIAKSFRSLSKPFYNFSSFYRTQRVIPRDEEEIKSFNNMKEICKSESLGEEIDNKNKIELYFDKKSVQFEEKTTKNYPVYKLKETSDFDRIPSIKKSSSLAEFFNGSGRGHSNKPNSVKSRFIEELGMSIYDNHYGILNKKNFEKRGDYRERVSNCYLPPYNCTVHLDLDFRIDQENQKEIHVGTGVLISPRHVLTAAHNLYNTNHSDNFSQIVNKALVTIGRDGAVFQKKFSAERLEIHELFKDKTLGDSRWDYDIGLLTLDITSDFGSIFKNQIQKVDLTPLNKDSILDQMVLMPGYPVNKSQMAKWFYMYAGDGFIKKVSDELLFHDIDCSGGNSGSGIFLKDSFKEGMKSKLLGVHSGFYPEEEYFDGIPTEIIRFVLEHTDDDLNTYIPISDYFGNLDLSEDQIKKMIDKTVNVLKSTPMYNLGCRITEEKVKKIDYWKSLK